MVAVAGDSHSPSTGHSKNHQIHARNAFSSFPLTSFHSVAQQHSTNPFVGRFVCRSPIFFSIFFSLPTPIFTENTFLLRWKNAGVFRKSILKIKQTVMIQNHHRNSRYH
jgi:hypothetical protein